jgi:hypothetical protein
VFTILIHRGGGGKVNHSPLLVEALLPLANTLSRGVVCWHFVNSLDLGTPTALLPA